MPRRRPAQPPTPDNLPDIPQGAIKKAYYSVGNLVYYLQTPDDREWRRGEISEETTSTTLHVVIDEASGYTYNVRAEYIRERSASAPATIVNQPDSAGEDYHNATNVQASSSAGQYGYKSHVRTDSTDSDQLGWSKERYHKETDSIDELADTLHKTHVGRATTTAWSQWEWNKERQQWGRYRMCHDEYEYEWQDPDSSSSKSKKSNTTAWSEWEWNEERQQLGRYRISHGEYEYEWKASESSHKGKGKAGKGKR